MSDCCRCRCGRDQEAWYRYLGHNSVWAAPSTWSSQGTMGGSPFPRGPTTRRCPPMPPMFGNLHPPGGSSPARTELYPLLATHVYKSGCATPSCRRAPWPTLDIVVGAAGRGVRHRRQLADGRNGSAVRPRLRQAAAASSTKPIDVCRRLWTESEVEHHGEFFDFEPW